MEYMSRRRTIMYLAGIALWSIFEISQSMAILRLQAENRKLADSNEILTAQLTRAPTDSGQVGQVEDLAGVVEGALETVRGTLEAQHANIEAVGATTLRLNQRVARLELGRDTPTEIGIEADGIASRLDGLERSIVNLRGSVETRVRTAENTIQSFRARLIETERIARGR